jgi:hypothetical protein
MTITKVLIDGGAELNIIFFDTLRKMGLEIFRMITLTSVPFYGIVPCKAAMPLGQITLSITFGTPTNYHTEFIKFEVADFEWSYHAIWATSIGQIHGNSALSISLTQDARAQWCTLSL